MAANAAAIEAAGPRHRIANAAAARALFTSIAHEPLEVAGFAYLDAERMLLGVRHARSLWRDALDLPLRDVTADALAFGAAALVLAHNHPSGDAEPSAADREATCRLVRVLHPLDVRVLDHLVLTRNGCTSFHARGWL